MSGPVRTLHVDVEGGWGGSSRSLYELVSRLDRARISPVVVHRQSGPVTGLYEQIGVPTRHVPEIGSFVPRKNKALKNLAATLPRLRRLGRAADRIAGIAREHGAGVIHLNYEGLFLLAEKLKSRIDLPVICHSRTHLPVSRWGRWLVRRLAENTDYMLFISSQERDRWAELDLVGGVPGEVMWNIARAPLAREPFAGPPEIVYLGSIDPTKGTDRLLDIAGELERRNAPPAILAVYGQARANPKFARALDERRIKEGVENRIEFRGHVEDVAPVLARAAALVRPSRDDDPWGRDLIEATAAGVPVLATGRFEGVVQKGQNGFLFDPFDAGAMAECLIELLKDPKRWRAMSQAGLALGRDKFGGDGQVERFQSVVESLVQHRSGAD